MFEGASDRRIKFRLEALSDQEPVSPSINMPQRSFTAFIQGLMLILDASPTGRALLQDSIRKKTSVGLDMLLEPSSSFFYPAQNHFDFGYQPEALQNTEKGVGRYLISFINGLRRAWHVSRGCNADLSLSPEEYLLLSRCEEADIEALLHLIGWELRAAGQASLWRYLLSGPDGDIAVVFERAVMESAQAQFDGQVLHATFDQWFAVHTRADACDRRALEFIDIAILERSAAGRVGTRMLTPPDIRKIGALPHGGNYLSDGIFTGRWYNGLMDERNRAHLRSLEQELAQLSSPSKENINL